MDDRRFGTVVRTVRQRLGWRQADLAARARVSPTLVSRIERGQCGSVQLDRVRDVADALGVRTDLSAWWRGGDLDRMLNARHSELHESVARYFAARHPTWELFPEVSFSLWGERGVIDILVWHPGRRALLVIELKTDIADVNELVGVVDRKRRLARTVAADRGWDPKTISVWVIVADGRTNRRRVTAHRAMLRNAFSADGRRMSGWLARPLGAVAALSYWREAGSERSGRAAHPVRRVRKVARSFAGDG
jgi:transcriptional regulator with XRE-family HTH domain